MILQYLFGACDITIYQHKNMCTHKYKISTLSGRTWRVKGGRFLEYPHHVFLDPESCPMHLQMCVARWPCMVWSGALSPGPPSPGKERVVSFPNAVAQIRRVREKSLVRNHAYPIKKMSTIVVFQISDSFSVCTLHVRSFLQTWPKKKK